MKYSLLFLMVMGVASNVQADHGADVNVGQPAWQSSGVSSGTGRTWAPRPDVNSSQRSASVAVTTYHNDGARTGQNLNETILNHSNVNKNSFGKIGSLPTVGQMYAQPLVAPVNVLVDIGQTTRTVVHNVVFVATEHDQVYAFDADTLNRTPIWHRNFLGDAAFPCPNSPCTTPDYTDLTVPNLAPESGITATPVIDQATSTIYFTAMTKENDAQRYHWRLHALDMATGAERTNSPVEITGSVPGMGTGNGEGGIPGEIPFSPLHQLSRAGLVLDHDRLTIAFTSFDDLEQTHGWVFTYNPHTLGQMGQWMSTPDSGDGTIWQAGGAPAVDAAGDLYFATGNGDPLFNSLVLDLADSIIKLGFNAGTQYGLTQRDFFTPWDHADLATRDVDLGSGGVMLLPDQPGSKAHLMVAGGKAGTIYLVDRDNLGQVSASNTDNVVQRLFHVIPGNSNYTGIFGTPSYYNNKVFMIPNRSYLISIPVTPGSGSTPTQLDWANKTSTGFIPVPVTSGTPVPTPTPNQWWVSHRGATTSISANGNSDGIVWYIDAGAYTYTWQGSVGVYTWDSTTHTGTYTTPPTPGPAIVTGNGSAVLYAWNADDITGTPLYRSNEINFDAAGNAVKFSVPTVANGQVYVGTDGELSVYGLAGLSTGIPEVKEASKLLVYPNPVPASVTLKVSSPNMEIGKADVTVVDLLGRTVISQKGDFTNGALVELDVSQLETGNYVLVIQEPNGEKPLTRKFVVSH